MTERITGIVLMVLAVVGAVLSQARMLSWLTDRTDETKVRDAVESPLTWFALLVAGVGFSIDAWRKARAEAKSPRVPKLLASIVYENRKVCLEIENQGATAEVTAQYLKAGIPSWPSKTVWCRWDHDKNAKRVSIPHRTKARIRIAAYSNENATQWTCHWGSDWAMAQATIVPVIDERWLADIEVQITTEPSMADANLCLPRSA